MEDLKDQRNGLEEFEDIRVSLEDLRIGMGVFGDKRISEIWEYALRC